MGSFGDILDGMDCLYQTVYTVEKAVKISLPYRGTQCADVGNDFGGFSGGSFATDTDGSR